MSYFTNNRKMYVPLSIDTVEARKSNYFLSNTKMLWAFLAMLPIFALLTPMIQAGVSIYPIIVVSVIYLIGYSFIIRYVIFEEKRLRKMVRELDENRISEMSHFWGNDKIGDGEEDDGIIYYSYTGSSKGTTKGLVVKLERGSTVGVPEGHYEDYRRVKENFLRSLHMNNFYPQCYEMQKRPEMQKSLLEYAEVLSGMKNEYHQRLLKLQLTINSVYSMGKNQRYVEYYVIKRDNFNKNFRRVVETILEDTFGQSGYITEATILDKRGVEEFYKNYLLVDTLDSNNVRKAVDVEPFENFAKVHRLVDVEGREVPIQFLDELDTDKYGGKDIDVEIKIKNKKDIKKEERRVRQLDIEIEKLNRKRNRDIITHDEYLAEKAELEQMYSPEEFETEDGKEKEREQKRKEREAKRNKRKEKGRKKVKVYDLNEKESKPEITEEETVGAVSTEETEQEEKEIEKGKEEEKENNSVFKKYNI